jgi:nucleotide-binding universal stress UspA family protein
MPLSYPNSERDRAASRRARGVAAAKIRRAPALIGVGADGYPGGRDAVALALLLATPTGGELLLIAVHKEPLLPLTGTQEMNWGSLENEYRKTLAETCDALAPDARIVIHPDVLVWRGLRHVVRLEHRDLLVVGSAYDADAGRTGANR